MHESEEEFIQDSDGKTGRKESLEDLDIDGSIILKLVLEK
jgi:hypothetical protein